MEPAHPRPLGQRVFDTFVAPHRLFATFRESAPWLGPLVISTLVAMLLMATVPDEAFVDLTRGAVNRRGEPVAVTSDPATVGTWGRLLGILTVLVYQPLIAFALAGILALLFGVLRGGPASYRQYLAVASHALLITALGALVGLALRLASGNPEIGPSLALLVPFPDRDGLLFRILAGVDLFTLWMLTVVAVGASTLNRLPGWGRAAASLVALYIGAIVLGAVLTG